MVLSLANPFLCNYLITIRINYPSGVNKSTTILYHIRSILYHICSIMYHIYCIMPNICLSIVIPWLISLIALKSCWYSSWLYNMTELLLIYLGWNLSIHWLRCLDIRMALTRGYQRVYGECVTTWYHVSRHCNHRRYYSLTLHKRVYGWSLLECDISMIYYRMFNFSLV